MTPTRSQYSDSKQQDCPDLIKGEQKSLEPCLQDTSTLPSIKSVCGLARLPVELFDMVLESLNWEEVFFLGIQTQHFWNVARRHLQAYVASCLGSWAGEGIICVGDYSEPKDLPLNVLTEVERKLQEGMKLIEYSDDSDNDSAEKRSENFLSDSTNLHCLAYHWYPKAKDPEQSLPQALIGHTEPEEWHRLPNSLKAQISVESHSYKISNFYPEDEPWILRNLTTHEYVRSEAITIKAEYRSSYSQARDLARMSRIAASKIKP